MALFLTNICKFEGCGLIFRTLPDLIVHIENTHIDFDPDVVEQLEMEKPKSLPMSYILPYCSEDTDKDVSCISPSSSSVGKSIALQHHNYSISLFNGVASDSDVDDYEYPPATTGCRYVDDFGSSTEEFSSEFIMRYYSIKQCGNEKNDKPFACPVPGCKKRYKNINGIKYHAKNGHKKNSKPNKFYSCHCGKNYKTAHGLKNHVLTAHNNSQIILPSTSALPQSLDLLSLSNINRLPSNFEGFYDSVDDYMYEENTFDSSTVYSQGMEGEFLRFNLSPNLEVNNYDESPPKPQNFEKAVCSSLPSYTKNEYEQNEEFIDVGDVSDCIYPFN